LAPTTIGRDRGENNVPGPRAAESIRVISEKVRGLNEEKSTEREKRKGDDRVSSPKAFPDT